MRRILFLGLAFFTIWHAIFAQESEASVQPFDLSGIIQKRQVEQYASIPVDQSKQLVTYKLGELMTNDVFGYFDIEGMFPTPLQRKNFKTLEEYGALQSEMKEQQAKLPDLEFKIDVGERLSQYDMKRGGFKVNFKFNRNPVIEDKYTCNIRMCNPAGKCALQACEGNKETAYPNAHLGFLFPQIAGKNNKATDISWFIKVDENNGSIIENSNAKVRIVFKIGKMQTKMHKTNKSKSMKLPNGYSISSKESHNMKLYLFETKIQRLEFLDANGTVVASITP